MINLSHNKNICFGKVFAKSRAWVYFEQQILALLFVFHQTGHATNLLMLKVFVSSILPPSKADVVSLIQIQGLVRMKTDYIVSLK